MDGVTANLTGTTIGSNNIAFEKLQDSIIKMAHNAQARVIKVPEVILMQIGKVYMRVTAEEVLENSAISVSSPDNIFPEKYAHNPAPITSEPEVAVAAPVNLEPIAGGEATTFTPAPAPESITGSGGGLQNTEQMVSESEAPVNTATTEFSNDMYANIGRELVAAITSEIRKTVESVVAKAIEPINKDVAQLKTDISEIGITAKKAVVISTTTKEGFVEAMKGLQQTEVVQEVAPPAPSLPEVVPAVSVSPIAEPVAQTPVPPVPEQLAMPVAVEPTPLVDPMQQQQQEQGTARALQNPEIPTYQQAA